LPLVGKAERHRHSYWLECGWHHEIRPDYGCTKAMQDMGKDIDPIVERIRGAYLNDVLPVPPTAEMLACWILVQLPPYWDYVMIRAYSGFMCKIERKYMTNAWHQKLRSSSPPLEERKRIKTIVRDATKQHYRKLRASAP